MDFLLLIKKKNLLNESLQIVGAFWYLLAVERNDTCLQKACSNSTDVENCKSSFYCSKQPPGENSAWESIFNTTCSTDNFKYGIYENALSSGVVFSSMKFVSKYCYCLWWGLQNLRYTNVSLFHLGAAS